MISFKKERVINWIFILLTLIIFGNLNGVVFGLTGIRAPFSPIILILSVLGISMLSKDLVTIIRHGGYLPWIFLIFLLTHMFIGVSSGLLNYDELHSKSSLVGGIRKMIPSAIIYLAYLLYFWRSSRNDRMMYALKMLFYCISISTIFIALTPFFGLNELIYDGLSISRSSRSAGLFANPNGAGIAANLSLVLAMFGLIRGSKHVLLYAIIFVVSLYAVFITFSKSALIVAAVILLTFLLVFLKEMVRSKSYTKFRMISTLCAFAFLGLMAVNKFGQYWNTLDYQQRQRIGFTLELLSGKYNKETTSDRSMIWEHAIDRISEKPFFGYGLESFHRLKDVGLGAHNTFIMIWGESGIFTLLIFVGFLFFLGFKSLLNRNSGIGFLVISILLILVLQEAMSGHNALESRISNACIALCVVLLCQPQKYIREDDKLTFNYVA